MELDDIIISNAFLNTPPRAEKIKEKQAYFEKYDEFEQPIVVDKDNVLIDGYTTYLLAKKYGINPRIKKI